MVRLLTRLLYNEYGQQFYTVLEGRSYELPCPRCSPKVTSGCHKPDPTPRGLMANLKSSAR